MVCYFIFHFTDNKLYVLELTVTVCESTVTVCESTENHVAIGEILLINIFSIAHNVFYPKLENCPIKTCPACVTLTFALPE